MQKHHWGIIGTGWIAHEMGEALLRETHEIYGVCDINIELAESYAIEFGVLHVFDSVEHMLQDPLIDIIYIATPHNLHAQFIKQALCANKHVFCEKVITVNEQQLNELCHLAKERNLIMMEGMTLYHMPIFQEVHRRIQEGALGKVKLVQVNFGSCKEYDVNNRFFARELAGGALLDIGVYAVSFARYFLDCKPNVVLSTVNYFETGVDESSGILMKNPQGQLVVSALTMRAKQPKRGVVACEHGYIEFNNYPRAEQATITYTSDGHQEVLTMGSSKDALVYEIRDMQRYIDTLDDEGTLVLTKDVTSLLSAIRNQWGFTYPFEKEA